MICLITHASSSLYSLCNCRVSIMLYLCLPGFYYHSGPSLSKRMWLRCLLNAFVVKGFSRDCASCPVSREIRTWKTSLRPDPLSPSNDWLIPQLIHEESYPVSPKGPPPPTPQINSRRTEACCTVCRFSATALPILNHGWSFLPSSGTAHHGNLVEAEPGSACKWLVRWGQGVGVCMCVCGSWCRIID